MKKFLFLFLALGLLAARPAAAEQPVVVELFTSQGCDKCPPAHILQKEYSQMSGAIVLTWHVEHWDFMGWRDTFAKPEFSERQYKYNRRFGRKGIYTPQAVINGREQVVASKKLELYTSIKTALAGSQMPVSVSFDRTARGVAVNVGRYLGDIRAQVYLVWVKSGDAVKVNSGTNIGKVFESINIVRHFDIIGTLEETAQTFSVGLNDPNRGDADKIAVLVQEEEVGRILGAALISIRDLTK